MAGKVKRSQMQQSENTQSMFILVGKICRRKQRGRKISDIERHVYIFTIVFLFAGIKSGDRKSLFSCFSARYLLIGV